MVGNLPAIPKPKRKRWKRLPPELHAKADSLLNEWIARPENQEKLRQGKYWITGLLMSAVTTALLYPKDSQWGLSNLRRKGGYTTQRLIREGVIPRPTMRKKIPGASPKGSSKVNDIG